MIFDVFKILKIHDTSTPLDMKNNIVLMHFFGVEMEEQKGKNCSSTCTLVV